MPDATQPPAFEDASNAAVTTPVGTALTESDDANLDSVLERLCSLSDEAATKEGKAKGNSIFKLATLKKIAKKLGLVCGQPKPDMISSLRAAASKSKELKVIEANKREGTYTIDKNTLPRIINLVFRYPDALQRSAAISTRQDLQNKETNGNKLIWTTVAEEFMNGTNSGGLVMVHEEFSKVGINPEHISKIGIMTPKQAHDLFKFAARIYAKSLPGYEASGRHNKKDFLDFVHTNKLDTLYLHCALTVANNPELSSFCLEGNVLHGGLDTSEVKGSSTESAVKSNKRKERQSNTKHQEDVLNYMKERNLGDSRSSKVTMLKDLTIALSVLNTTWIEMDNKIVALEDDNNLDANPRKQARLVNYKSILRENEKEAMALKAELESIRNPVLPAKIIPTPASILDSIPDDALNMSIESDFEDNTNNDESFHSLPPFDYAEFSDADEIPINSSSSASTSSMIHCCCGCKENASYSSHVCSHTKKRAMAFCLTGEEGYGSSSICRGCEILLSA